MTKSNSQQAVATHTWLRGPLKDRDAPLPLRDSDRELIHAVSGKGVYHHSSLGAVLVLPACWLTLLSVPNCVGSELRENGNVYFHWFRFYFTTYSHFLFLSLSVLLTHAHFNRPHLDAPGATFPISTAGSTQEMRTDWGDMTLTLMSRASYSGGSVGSRRHTQKNIEKKCPTLYSYK